MAGRKPKVNRSSTGFVRDEQVVFRSELGERIRSVLDEFPTRNEAAAVAGVTPEHLASYIGGRAKPPFELLARLAAAKTISLDWLASGNGTRSTAEAEPEGYAAIPLRGDADARYDAGEETPPLLFARAWLNARSTAPDESLCLVVHRGTSNEPVIRDGDLLLVDMRVTRIGEDGLYVFPRDGKYLARFVEKLFDDRVALKARNPDYGVQTLARDEAQKLPLLGRVLWRGGVF